MGSFKTLAWAGLVAMASTAASAADLLPPPPPMHAPVAHAPVEIGSGWYLRGDVGVGILDARGFELGATAPTELGVTYEIDQKSIGDQAIIGIGAGFQLNSWFRADVTAEYRAAAQFALVERAHGAGFVDGFNRFSGKLSSFVLMANAYADLGTWHGITPFIGAGVGIAHHRVNGFHDVGFGRFGGGFGYAGDESNTSLAWALHAGLGYHVSQNLKLELSYRYLNMGKAETGTITCAGGCDSYAAKFKTIDSHDIRLGMRWLLNAPAAVPVAYDAPIIRKY